jgi:hypothetical protein
MGYVRKGNRVVRLLARSVGKLVSFSCLEDVPFVLYVEHTEKAECKML